MPISKARLRQIHFTLAPILLFSVLLSLLTGSLFQVAVLTNRANDFLWLLELHKGKFGQINLEMIYPFQRFYSVCNRGILAKVCFPEFGGDFSLPRAIKEG
ncbi:PepSY domain-containing protein [Lusitaniella coriacea LEGE 07157]|uniref:PepSY domain-containing protein n=1 Tax=Lusitaniella coriacea LEGE 07157 TaxID=945747 RepID=A0A8J7JDX2_9CYAN|nr:PepSY domain-containing protein [Lusitaniella coriacea]MBE9118095.1 PepSY domain-containing protein [Lusitaniella coriacea LEGE 07157]